MTTVSIVEVGILDDLKDMQDHLNRAWEQGNQIDNLQKGINDFSVILYMKF